MKIWNIPSFGTWCSQNKPAVKWFIHFRQNCKTLEHTIFKNLWDPNLCSVREGFKNSPQQISNIITSFSWTSGINGKIHKFTDEEFFNPSLTYLVLALWRASPVSTLSCCFWRVSPSLAGAGRPETNCHVTNLTMLRDQLDQGDLGKAFKQKKFEMKFSLPS